MPKCGFAARVISSPRNYSFGPEPLSGGFPPSRCDRLVKDVFAKRAHQEGCPLARSRAWPLRGSSSTHQVSFNANWICLDVVAVEVTIPAPPTPVPDPPSKMALLVVGALKLV